MTEGGAGRRAEPDCVEKWTGLFWWEILCFPRRIPYHSIIGDRGQGGSPNSSDGVVPYWSSHLPGAVSEKIVPSGHGVNKNAEGIEEIRRITGSAGTRRVVKTPGWLRAGRLGPAWAAEWVGPRG